MKFIRQIKRVINYKLKFYGKENTDLNYLVHANVSKELKELMTKYGSDKGNLNKHHNFADLYSSIFSGNRGNIKNFLEVGLGSNNINVLSNVGYDGKPLASLRAWRDYFPNAQIYGADIDSDILINEERIKTFFVDQTKPDTIIEMLKKIDCNEFDVILDDALHTFEANICLFENTYSNLKYNGIYIIEDIYYKDKIKFIKYFKEKKILFSLIDIYHENNIANNGVVIIKKNENL